MDSYNVSIDFFEESEDGFASHLLCISFLIGDIKFASFTYDFDETPMEEVSVMIDAMSGKMAFATIYQNFSNGSSEITFYKNVVTFKTTRFCQSTTFKCIVNDSLIDAFIQIENYCSLM